MKKMYMVLLTLLLFSCNNQREDQTNPFQRMDNYNGNFELSIKDRLLDTPSIIIDILSQLDNVNNYSSYELNDQEKQIFMDYFELLPLRFKNIITEKVFGIYFVNNFLGGGYTLPIFDNDGNMYMALFFNPEIMNQKICVWINFRDNSAFTINDSKISVNIEINSQFLALIHTLVHEASHVYDYYNYVTPYTEPFLRSNKTIFPTEFVKGIWINYNETMDEYNFIQRENIYSYDLGERINKKYVIEIYQALKQPPFSSIYGSKNWAEDFAESFTWWYLFNYFNINYITKIFDDENLMFTFNPNENELVKARYKIYESLLE